jgi:diacylglycerol O-acyltransferase / trehalose O-mycolyltransferase
MSAHPAHARPRRRALSRTALTATVVLAAAVGLPAAPVALAAPAGAAAPAAVPTATADDGAQVIAEKWLDARTVDLTVQSPAVGSAVPVRVILPTNWATQTDRTWPVLYLLQGAHDDYTSWTRETDIEAFTADKDVITVMPSAGPTGIPTKWYDNGQSNGPDYETFQVTELMQLLQRGYRAGTARVIGGVSTGGYGALALAAKHPGTFSAAASYSGILDTMFPGIPTIVMGIVAREGLNSLLLWGLPYLSNQWQNNNPANRANGLRGTALYISQGSGVVGGNGDPTGEILESTLWPQAQSFALRLGLMGIPATTHFYTGGVHDWSAWQGEFNRSWPILAKGLGLPAAQSVAPH